MEQAGLYIHIPFCLRKCGYCDFYSITRLSRREAFVQALLREMELIAPHYRHLEFDTIFIGGGTPTVLTQEQLQQIREKLYQQFRIASAVEFTMEANPGTVSFSLLSALHSMGVNRLSLGAQSFFEEDLRFLERIHTVEEIYSGFQQARRAGFDNINLDLITAFPGLTPERFHATLEYTLELAPEHISCYTLIFEPGTPFYRRLRAGEMQAMDQETEAQFYQLTNQVLGEAGYRAYEISNFARESRWQCQHNLKYWRHQPYLGLGPSAHSFVGNRRWWNVRSLRQYIKRLNAGELPVANGENLSEHTRKFEYIFLHLRLREGISLTDYSRRFGTHFLQEFASALEPLRTSRFLEVTDERVRLTERGWLLADEIASYFRVEPNRHGSAVQ